ncbi:MAG: helix-turn-helix transcriptional regulator [Nitrososphaerota archaeon]|nr:helix-turn-helix transcriptional regulator [Nitrososphaerota archaeon]MDG6939821.1 helix-turn-helix transcriptional regulator [Nitrososphaerota archaeon]
MPRRPARGHFADVQGAPRGLIMHYMLHRISQKPSHGYEILKEIESRTEGDWKPGAGSIYPILRKLVSEGYIEAEEARSGGTGQRVYHITGRGLRHMKEAKESFLKAGKRWVSMRKIFMDLIGPEDVSSLVLEGSKRQFGLARELFRSRSDQMDGTEVRYILQEYILNLEMQLEWARSVLKQGAAAGPEGEVLQGSGHT